MFEKLIGKKIAKIFIDEEDLVFIDSDDAVYGYTVYGDCCSHSYFHDFIGVEKLLQNGPILEVHSIDLVPSDEEASGHECLQAYGFSFVTENPKFGEQTSVLSFRNSSNGYYGGWVEELGDDTAASRIDSLTELRHTTMDVSNRCLMRQEIL